MKPFLSESCNGGDRDVGEGEREGGEWRGRRHERRRGTEREREPEKDRK